ncbi:MAG: TolC family protein, partial [Candidatus Neomarinimicrobiota bacterium]
MKKKILYLTIGLLFLTVTVPGQVLTLDQCIDMALKYKETVKAAALGVKSAEYGKRGALSNILPSLGAGAGYSMSSFKERTNYATGTSYNSSKGTSWGLQLTQPVYDGGAWWNSIAGANNNYLISQQQERQVRINVIYGVIQAYYSLLKAQQLLDVARMNLMLANQQVELVTNQFEIGAAAKTDLLKVNVLKGQAQVDVIARDAELQNATRNLRNAIGLMDNTDPLLVDESAGGEYTVPELLPALNEMTNSNPSILAKKAQIGGAILNHKIIRGSRLPNVSVGWRYNYQSADVTGLVADFDWSSAISLELSIPLFTGFDLSTRTQQAKLNISNEEYEFTTQLHDLRVQLEGLLEILRNYRETIPINEEVLVSAEEDLKLVQEQYALGSVTILEVLDAQLSVTRARSSLVSYKYDAQ